MAEPSDRFALLGTIVADKYSVERVVGEGGFGVVFRATHRIWDEPVALKCFTALSNAPVEVRDELLDQFVQEGKLLSKLSSRTTGIVQARDIGTLTDDLALMDSGFDSLCFAVLVAQLEDDLGLDPFSSADDIEFPVTLGDFIALYENAAGK